MGPHGPVWAHIGPYGPNIGPNIEIIMGPYGPNMGPYWNTYLNKVKNNNKAKTDKSMEGKTPGAENQESQKGTNQEITNGEHKAEKFAGRAKRRCHCCPKPCSSSTSSEGSSSSLLRSLLQA